MNIKTKLTLNIGVLVAMIVLLVSLSVVNLQILTATEPTSPAAGPGLQRALVWVSIIGGLCIVCGLWMLKQSGIGMGLHHRRSLHCLRPLDVETVAVLHQQARQRNYRRYQGNCQSQLLTAVEPRKQGV